MHDPSSKQTTFVNGITFPECIFAFAIGVLSLWYLPRLPNFSTIILGLILFSCLTLSSLIRIGPCIRIMCACVGIVGIGCYYALWRTALIIPLPEWMAEKPYYVSGEIMTPVTQQSGLSQCIFRIDTTAPKTTWHLPAHVRLSWFHPKVLPELGSHWHLWIKLKPPHTQSNPGTWDNEQWLLSEHIRATAYVMRHYPVLRMHSKTHTVRTMRNHLSQAIANALPFSPTIGFITALVTGDRSRVTDHDWDYLQKTGTNHLIAIAGLHIGLVSGATGAIVHFLWKRTGFLLLFVPTPIAAIIAALIAGTIYSGLSGFALPTQRAVCMLTVYLIIILLKRTIQPWYPWCVALLCLLLYDPLQIIGMSFWLSFGTVALIIYALAYRVQAPSKFTHITRLQWVISTGLTPLTLCFFHTVSATNVLANMIAVPWVGCIVLPLSFIGGLLYFVTPSLAALLWKIAAYTLAPLLSLLNWLAYLPHTQWTHPLYSTWQILLACVGIFYFNAPKGIPLRSIGMMGILSLIYWPIPKPQAGTAWITVLDVGQGLSVIAQTMHHTLIYDTGARYNTKHDEGNAVVVPYLHHYAIRQVDTMIISHPDNDHAGGARSIAAAYPHISVYSSTPELFKDLQGKACPDRQTFVWDGITFTLFNVQAKGGHMTNNHACVLSIRAGNHAVLLPGDIERPSESVLVQQYGNPLRSDVLVIPHHGSTTSSTLSFLNAVQPKWGIFSTGYRNRFHFPKPEIIERYHRIGTKLYNTATDGAISFIVSAYGINTPSRYRATYRHLWQYSQIYIPLKKERHT